MVLQIVRWIIGGTDHGNLEFFDDSLGREILKALVGLFPNARSGSLVEKLSDIEIPLQLEMGPMIERVADRSRNGLGVREEFVVIAGVTSDIAFRNAMSPHRSPFVVIAVSTVV